MSDKLTTVKPMGEVPNPRFGHTFTRVSRSHAVLFGGAVGDQGKFVITN
jgi:protein phosphatase